MKLIDHFLPENARKRWCAIVHVDEFAHHAPTSSGQHRYWLLLHRISRKSCRAPAQHLFGRGSDDVAEPFLHHLLGGYLPDLDIEHRIDPRA